LQAGKFIINVDYLKKKQGELNIKGCSKSREIGLEYPKIEMFVCLWAPGAMKKLEKRHYQEALCIICMTSWSSRSRQIS